MSAAAAFSTSDREGHVVRIAGPVVVAEGLHKVRLYNVVRVGRRRLIGEVIRLNQKTATILADDRTKWRVGYGLLYLVIDGERGFPNLIEGEIVDRK